MSEVPPGPGAATNRTSHHAFEGRLSAAWPDNRMKPVIARQMQHAFRSFASEMRMDLAHTVMLIETGVLAATEGGDILRALLDIESGGPEGLRPNGKNATLFWYVEEALIARLGVEVGGRMHTGRSHNDIMPTLGRMEARDHVVGILTKLVLFRRSLLALAATHDDTIMPGYTALQHGQPWTFGHYLCGIEVALRRDFERFSGTYARTNMSPLGASALAGSAWPLDRKRTAELLGFDAVMIHSRDAGFGTKDYVAEALANVAIMMNNLNALASDLYLWSSFEFGMVALADAFCGTSSIMPQKRNAWALDWTRGAAGNAVGYFASCLASLRGSSSTDGSAQHYPERSLQAAMGEAAEHLSLMTGVIETLEVNVDVMVRRAHANWATASELADALVRKCNLSFRSAHGVVGRLVRNLSSNGLGPLDATGAALDTAANEILGRPLGLSDVEVRQALDPYAFVASRRTQGSVKPDEVRSMIDDGLALCDRDEGAATLIGERLATAERSLRDAIRLHTL